jgi:hypothetical protein
MKTAECSLQMAVIRQIRHENIGMKDPSACGNNLAQEFEKVAAMAVIPIGGTMLIAATRQMPDRPREFEAERSGHAVHAEEDSSDRRPVWEDRRVDNRSGDVKLGFQAPTLVGGVNCARAGWEEGSMAQMRPMSETGWRIFISRKNLPEDV